MKTLVIGGTCGFGAALTNELRLAGYTVVTVGRSGGNYICDVSDIDAWQTIAMQIARDHEKFDLMVCVVGYARAKDSAELTDADWTAHASANLWYVETALALIPHRRFVTTGSQWSYKIGNDQLIPYIQSKHALRVLTERKGGAHYCVPTMDTPQLWQVWGGSHPAPSLASSSVVAWGMATHLISHSECATYTINANGGVALLLQT